MPKRVVTFLIGSIVLVLIGSCSVIGQWQTIGRIVSWKNQNHVLLIDAPPARVQITVLQPDVVRIRVSIDGIFQPDSSWAVVGDITAQQVQIDETEKNLSFSTARLTVEISKSPFRLSFFDRMHHLINRDDSLRGISWAGNEIVTWKNLPKNEHYYGFGEKSTSLDKRGIAMSMWNSDIPAYSASTDPLYQDIPFFYGVTKDYSYGIFFDNTYHSFFDMGKEDPQFYSFGASGGELNYYFILGLQPKDILTKYSQLVGTMPLPPRWALGYQQCRWSYYPEKRVREIASLFRSKHIPCDAIYLDIHYMDGYRCFTWDSTRFPDPVKMVTDLRHEGFKTVVIIDPGIKIDSTYWVFRSGITGDHFLKFPDGSKFVGQVWPGDCFFPDFTSTTTRSWWGSLFKGLVDCGIKGFWNDMNEPSVFNGPDKTINLEVVHNDGGLFTDHRKNHNIYGMQMARATREGVQLLKPDERPFVLTRANYAGGQRYSAAWTGDNCSTWDNLQMVLPMCLNLSISGQPFVGSDIGGFIGSPSGELYTRWLEAGVFTPLMRSHAEINSPNKEPWEYGKEFEDINRATIELRYKFLPYLYSAFKDASETGCPMMLPLVFDNSSDQDTYYTDDEFIFGENILVAPVLWPGLNKRTVYLPAGGWYDYWTNISYHGSQSISVDAPLDRLPFFVRAGSVIPTRATEQYTDQLPMDTLFLTVYPLNNSAKGTLYEDDGVSFDYQGGQFALRRFSLEPGASSDRLTLQSQVGQFRPTERSIIISIVARENAPRGVTEDGKPLSRVESLNAVSAPSCWSYNAEKKVVMIRIPDKFRQQVVGIGHE